MEAVIQAEQREERKAAVPEVIIDLSHLEQIRQDAQVTRDSLLTGEEMDFAADAEDSLAAQQMEETGRLGTGREKETESGDGALDMLDMIHRQILLALARNQSAESYLKAGHLMPSVAADTINEALFDEIGDNVLEWDGDTITLVEDYRDDVLQMFGGKDNE